MGGSWGFLVFLVASVIPVRTQAQLEFNITTTWNGEDIDHEPIQLTLSASSDGQYLELGIEAPFFNDPAAPPGPPGQPFFGLWNYEVVEAFFLNDDNQYVEVEVCPYGQHIVLLLKAQRVTIRHSLPLEVETTIYQNTSTWSGTARIPLGYLPKNVTKFNAYGIHGSGDNRIYESLYPAPKYATAPDFHALEYFQEIDLSEILLVGQNDEISELWTDSLEGIFRYRIKTTWDGQPIDHPPAAITLQGLTGGVEMNITAPFFNDPAPNGPPGEPFYGLWDYEVVEMFFLNGIDEYLEVELGPWGQHLLLMLKGARNTIKHSLPLDYIVERNEGSGNNLGTWKGSALIPPEYFPPNVSKMNAYAIHGVDENREYQALYPAPAGDPAYPSPDFHRLELFQPIDFEYQVTSNDKYSDLWEKAINSGSTIRSSVVKTEAEEKDEAVTVLGRAEEIQTTFAPESRFDGVTTEDYTDATTFATEEVTEDEQTTVSNTETFVRIPSPQRIKLEDPREQRQEGPGRRQPTSAGHKPQTPQPVRLGNRRRRPSSPPNRQRRPPLNQPARTDTEFHGQAQGIPQFQDESLTQDSQLHQSPRPFRNQEESQGQLPVPSKNIPQRGSHFTDENHSFPNLDQSPSSSQFQPQGQLFGTSPIQSEQRPVFPVQPQRPLFQEESLFQDNGHSFQNQRQPAFQSGGLPPFQNQRQPPFQSEEQRPFQNNGQIPFQSEGRPSFPNQEQSTFQNERRPSFQNQGQSQFQNDFPQFQNPSRPQLQDQNQAQPPIHGQRPPHISSNINVPVGDESHSSFNIPDTGSFQSQGPPRFEQGRPSIQFPKPSLFDELDPSIDQTLPNEPQSFDVPGSETSAAHPSKDVGLQETLTPAVEQAVITLAEETPALPPPHPVCFELGLVPDPDRCYVFHECVLEGGEWQMYSWRCRRGQIFDPVNVACVRGRCARNRSRRRRVRQP